jgi:hypothetical protein
MRKIALALAAVMVVAVAPAQVGRSAPPDVPRDHWAFPAVDELFRLGLLRGYPDGQFRGNRPLTRYEMAGILNQANLDLAQRMSVLNARLDALEGGRTAPAGRARRGPADDGSTLGLAPRGR